ncbi:MAG: peptidoglycan editing factor PgeF [Pseudobdellovibrionaceae bacterium]|nr:peptidoglycan editing factor PgeF [Pseudobdellovibrionaceae bacterium]
MKSLEIPEIFSERVAHGFFGKKGGVSKGVFESLNVTPYSGDDVELVHQNREIVRVSQKAKQLVTLKQIHSAICLDVTNVPKNDSVIEGDALVTDQKGVALGVMTADCAPVLLEGHKANGDMVIGAAHAGWGGALRGVCESTIDKMCGLGCVRETIKAAIGPCIGKTSYEVKDDFKRPFLDHDQHSSIFFVDKGESLYFDLEAYVSHRLQKAGICQVVGVGQDTYLLEQDYFSFRRSTHRGEPEYGRQISVITII